MTCIVGLVDKDKGRVWMGSDSMGSDGYTEEPRADVKMFKKGKFLIGCTTSFRMIQILQYSFSPPKVKKREIHEYMCTDFIDAVRSAFDAGGFGQKTSEGEERGGSFLVAVNGRLFNIGADYQVGESLRGYDAIGSGVSFALGSMYANGHLSCRERIKSALLAAGEFSTGVRGPYVIKNA